MPQSDKEITVVVSGGRTVAMPASPGESLAQALFLAGIWTGRPLCSGLGRCGLCRVRYASNPPEPVSAEARLLSPEDLARGVRLACRHQAGPGDCIELEAGASGPLVSGRPAAVRASALAVDLGTTSLQWSLLGRDGARLAAGGETNPQMGSGSEVMSRLAFAADPERRAYLRDLVLGRLAELGTGTERLALAGNSAMVYILLGLDVNGLSRAPYRLDYRAGEWVRLAPGLPEAYIPPLLAPFVGADLSGGLAAIRFGDEPRYPFLLADLGTNGEFILALDEDRFLAASVPMGPALEGIGLTFGAMAGVGAASSFALSPAGLVPGVIGGGEARRITGTGYLSLLAALKRAGFLAHNGSFAPEAGTPLAARLRRNLVEEAGERRFRLTGHLYLSAADVEETLKVKAAFNVAVASLLRDSGLGFDDLRRVYLAGALGEHVAPGDLEELGFLPAGSSKLAVVAGNTSLAGAELALQNAEARRWMERLPDLTRLVEFTGHDFSTEYLSRMVFEYVS